MEAREGVQGAGESAVAALALTKVEFTLLVFLVIPIHTLADDSSPFPQRSCVSREERFPS